MERFQDRADAGMYLVDRLQKYANKPDTIVLGLPRGGVVVAFEVAQALGLPLDIFLVRKLGVPGYEEVALGAIASGGVQFINQDVVNSIRISPAEIQNITAKEAAELKRREDVYRETRPILDVRGKIVILVDDGLATGATMQAAVEALRKMSPRKIVIAVPVASVDACNELGTKVDEIVCGITPSHFNAVGAWYDDFSQTTDKEVIQLLKESDAFGQTAEAM